MSDFLKQKKDMTELDYKELSQARFLPGVEFKDLTSKDSKEAKLFLPSELHFPSVAQDLSTLRAPTLLVVSWPNLEIDSDAGQFLKKLGVREVVIITMIIIIITITL